MKTTNDAAIARHNGQTQAVAQARPSFADVAAEQWKIAEAMAKSDIIPKDFRGKPANVFVALEMAHRLGLGPMEAMQNLYVVHGTPSMSAKFLIALANRSGRFRGGLQFKESPNAVTCFAIDRETNERLEVEVTLEQAKRAGWTKNSKYVEMQNQMLAYRAATFFVRRYCPEVSLGFVTVEEAQEMPRDVEAGPVDPLDAVLAAPDEAAEVPAEPIEYVPESQIAGLLKSYARLGLEREYVEERFGPLDQMTRETYQEAVAEGLERKREWEEQARKRDAQPTAESLYGDDMEDEEVAYD